LSYEILIKDKVVIKQPSNGRDKSYIGTQKSKFNCVMRSKTFFQKFQIVWPWETEVRELFNGH
jgi:hypothetical protein